MSTAALAFGDSNARAPLGFRRYTPCMALRLKELRLAAGLTQVELAARAGIERSQYSKIENEKEPANTRRLASLAQALGVTVSDLFSDDADETRSALLAVFEQLTDAERDAVIAHARALALAHKK